MSDGGGELIGWVEWVIGELSGWVGAGKQVESREREREREFPRSWEDESAEFQRVREGKKAKLGTRHNSRENRTQLWGKQNCRLSRVLTNIALKPHFWLRGQIFFFLACQRGLNLDVLFVVHPALEKSRYSEKKLKGGI